MAIQVDIAVLGGGPGGYTAAIRAAQAGKKVALIERDKLGGTCLHQGCIPSKSLLRSAEVYRTILTSAQYGINVNSDEVSLDFDRVQERKRETVDQLYRGLQSLMKKHGITVIQGKGRVIGPSIFSPRSGSLAVELADGEMESVVSTNLIIATGSRPRLLPGLKRDGIHILTSDDALELDKLPASILIVGGGVIGVEWASLLQDFGVDVTLIEAGSRLIPGEDAEVSAALARSLGRRGVRVLTSVELQSQTCEIQESGGVSVKGVTPDGDVTLVAEKMLVCVGREGNADGIGLENTDVRTNNGFIVTNEFGQTTEPHIYAIGDVVGGIQLAHAAAHEGLVAVDHIMGAKPAAVDHHLIPKCIYSSPEVASYGYTEDAARTRGYDIKVGKIPFQAIGKAIVLGEQEGFAKVIADRKSGDILGVHLIGPHATDLISEAALAGWLNATPWEVGAMIHPHPTLSEALGEAMLAVDGKAIVY
ncbi:dihydrolipoyl dehydrogenase [Paenibacillus sp. MY03]|jgi:dihydrolipoamide dehydrogenase|uniref:dihydrolipoyl dehydrogenase n=1 Tax=Paenibacillus sp. MY03 TaxID=302980 RepID=UPI000B3C4E0F|nr:dihydrolipoyl dehydrogenase [Paenibacillus sp. MY03]OUS77444.1 dihydrolipoyl dehydrogenase [Paenibacillus sp. MY03]